MAEQVLLKIDGTIAEVILNRTDRRNALDRALLEEMLETLSRAVEHPGVHVVILHGNGPGFCSGADVEMMAGLPSQGDPAAAFMPAVDVFQQVVTLLATAPRITMAAAHGFALGAGLDLALACDLRIAAAGTQFASNYVRFGLVPDGGGTWALPRLIGLGPAMAMLLSGDPIDVEGAYRLGLVHRRTATERHLVEARHWAEELSQRSLLAQVAIKRLARIDPRLTLSAALKEERESQRRIVADGEPFRFLGGAVKQEK